MNEAVDLSLRKPTEEDYIDSRLRKHIFNTIEQMEVPRSRILGDADSEEFLNEAFNPYLLTDANNRLYDWQVGVAIEHWKCEYTT